jgi:hypothetical protein
MSHSESTFRLRVIEGPLEGATYLLRDSFVLGRSGECDLAMLDRRVSRLHARVGRDRAGSHMIHDLGSVNGTRVNGAFVRRQTLSEGDEIEIGAYRFIYERIARRRTVVPSVGAAGSVASGREPASGPSRYRVYVGDLLGDVMTYRSLAAALVREGHLEQRELAQLRVLDEGLRDRSDPDGYFEFALSRRVDLRPGWMAEGAGVASELVSIGVAGATLRRVPDWVAPGEVVHLVFARDDDDTAPKTAFTGVVVAGPDAECRVAFSMSSQWAVRMAALQASRTIAGSISIGPAIVRYDSNRAGQGAGQSSQ